MLNHAFSDIIEYWDEILNMGTDLQRLKFHGQLLTMYKVSSTKTSMFDYYENF